MKASIWIYWVVSSLICFIVGYTKTGSWDIWWHLLTGSVAWDGIVSLARDPFSFTYLGEPWHYKDSVADMILYLGFDKLEFVWFGLLKGLVVISLAVALSLYAQTRKIPLALAAIVMALSVSAIQYRIIERPIVFSLMIYPLFLFALKEAFSKSTLRPRLRWSAAVVGILGVWCFLHRAALIGFPLVLLVGYASWLRDRVKSGSVEPSGPGGAISFLQPLGIVVVGGLVSLAHPEGTELWTTAIDVAQSAELKAHISEWSRLTPAGLLSDFPLASWWIVIGWAYCLVDAVHSLKKRKEWSGESLVDLAVLTVFLGLVLSSVRYIPYTAIYASFPVLRLVHRLYRFLSHRLKASGRMAMYPAAVLFVMATNQFPPGLGEMTGRYPRGAVEFMRESGVEGPVMNAFHLAGYTLWHLWPRVHVFVDGRNDMVYPPKFVVEALEAQRNESTFKRFADEHSVDWVLAANDVIHSTHLFLAGNPRWSLVYWSEEALVYVRRGRYAPLDEQRFRHVDPRTIDGSVVRVMTQHDRVLSEALGRELQRMLKASPESRRAISGGAIFFHFLGPEFYPRRDALVEQLSKVEHGAALAVKIRAQFSQNSR